MKIRVYSMPEEKEVITEGKPYVAFQPLTYIEKEVDIIEEGE